MSSRIKKYILSFFFTEEELNVNDCQEDKTKISVSESHYGSKTVSTSEIVYETRTSINTNGRYPSIYYYRVPVIYYRQTPVSNTNYTYHDDVKKIMKLIFQNKTVDLDFIQDCFTNIKESLETNRPLRVKIISFCDTITSIEFSEKKYQFNQDVYIKFGFFIFIGGLFTTCLCLDYYQNFKHFNNMPDLKDFPKIPDYKNIW